MKILIINAYAFSNRGDAAIVVSMIRLLQQIWPNCEISVMSSYWERNVDFYRGYGVRSVPNVWSLDEGQGTLSRYVSGISTFIQAFWKPDSSKFVEINSADLVCSAGGGYIYSSRKGPFGVGLLNVLFHYWLSAKLGKTVIGFPQSVGPLNFSLDRIAVRSALKKVTRVYSREAKTSNVLRGIGLSNFKEFIDIAFLLSPKSLPKNVKFDDGHKLGITVLDWRFADSSSSEASITQYLDSLRVVVLKFLQKYPDGSVYIFPQVDVGGEDSDVPISQRLEKLVDLPRCRYFSLESVNDPEVVVAIYQQMNCFIGSRMHSTIFSLIAGTPTIALAYQPKTTGTFQELGLSQYAFPIKDFSADAVFDQVVQCCENGQRSIEDFRSSARRRIREDIVNLYEQQHT